MFQSWLSCMYNKMYAFLDSKTRRTLNVLRSNGDRVAHWRTNCEACRPQVRYFGHKQLDISYVMMHALFQSSLGAELIVSFSSSTTRYVGPARPHVLVPNSTRQARLFKLSSHLSLLSHTLGTWRTWVLRLELAKEAVASSQKCQEENQSVFMARRRFSVFMARHFTL